MKEWMVVIASGQADRIRAENIEVDGNSVVFRDGNNGVVAIAYTPLLVREASSVVMPGSGQPSIVIPS